MGQFLSLPATNKLSETGANTRLIYGLAAMQGWRVAMEDGHAAVLDLDGPEESSNAFFAVYDGHGGSSVSKYAAQNLHKRLVEEGSYKEQNWEVALRKAFLGTDEDLRALESKEQSGCTAVAALVTNDNKIYVANAGDSRSVLSVKGKMKPLSVDHKPTNRTEIGRIKAAGGFLENGRVNGSLALSRALGDFALKQNSSLPPEAQIMTADPDVTCHEVTEEDEFLVLACDGIWDCLDSQSVVNFVRFQVSEGKELTDICEMMLDHCLAPDTDRGDMGCDNMTLLLVALTHGRTKKAWYKWIKERVKKEYGYETPGMPSPLYTPRRLAAFRERVAAIEERKKLLAKAQKAKERRSLVAIVVAYLTDLVGMLSAMVLRVRKLVK